MNDQATQLLLKKVKKHKKWTEGIFVNPIFWMVNGKPYYMAGFTKKNASVATAYVTPGEENREEALEAQRHLALFGDLSNNIFNIGMDYLKINAAFFTKPLSIPVSTLDSAVLEGREAFAELWKIQQNLTTLIKDYKNYYENDVLIRKEIVEADVIKTLETANLLTLYQYLNLQLLLEKNAEIQAFASFLKTTEDWNRLGEESQKFVQGITDNAEKMRKNLNGLNVIADQDFENMKKLNYDKMIEDNKKIIEGQRQYIRYPK
ncbi:hypothetical protein QWY16_16090 [Planococcus shenhongbingii]|uniref:hypothetical protein n=1 Tax=Planococcus shenhongbingii TaxID=3058398 RepID=UPI0026194A7F|nr:hypothetical protein [Planococcus sp. N016]WKA58003.1 hypothetical protein QWY16_16090 [Planococcus sp. N016]